MLVVVGNRQNNKSVWAYDDENNLLWDYDTGDNTRGVVLDDSNNVYVIGQAADNGDGHGTRNLWKLDSSGSYLGGRYVGSDSYAHSIALDNQSRIIVGTTSGASRVSADLSLEVQIRSGGAFTAVAVDSQGNIYLGSGGIPSNLYKYNSSLVFQWSKDPHTSASCTSIVVMEDDSIIASIEGSGNKVYHYPSDGSGGDTGDWQSDAASGNSSRIVLDEDENIYGTGMYGGAGRYLIKWNSSGSLQWEKSINGDICFTGIFLTSDGVVHLSATNTYNCSVYRYDSSLDKLVGFLSVGTSLQGLVVTSGSSPGQPIVEEYESNPSQDIEISTGSSYLYAQTFTPQEYHKAGKVKLYLGRDHGGVSGTMLVKIVGTTPEGKPDISNVLAEDELEISSIFPIMSVRVLDVFLDTLPDLVKDTKYAFVWTKDSGGGLRVGVDSTLNYSNGEFYTSDDEGVSWELDETYDLYFDFWGEDSGVAPTIIDQSDDTSVFSGQLVELFITATGEPSPTYQWYKNDIILSGETSATLSFYASTTATYKCKVTNFVGYVWSDSIVVSVVSNPYCYNPFDLQLDLDRTD